jgi:hypothetical protein
MIENEERKQIWARIQSHDNELAALKETVDLLMKGVFGLERKKGA